MSLARLLERLESRSRIYLLDIKAGRKNPRLAAELFGLCDQIRAKVPSQLREATERLSRETEAVVRIANTGRLQEIEATRLQQIDTIAAARTLLKPEVA